MYLHLQKRRVVNRQSRRDQQKPFDCCFSTMAHIELVQRSAKDIFAEALTVVGIEYAVSRKGWHDMFYYVLYFLDMWMRSKSLLTKADTIYHATNVFTAFFQWPVKWTERNARCVTELLNHLDHLEVNARTHFFCSPNFHVFM